MRFLQHQHLHKCHNWEEQCQDDEDDHKENSVHIIQSTTHRKTQILRKVPWMCWDQPMSFKPMLKTYWMIPRCLFHNFIDYELRIQFQHCWLTEHHCLYRTIQLWQRVQNNGLKTLDPRFHPAISTYKSTYSTYSKYRFQSKRKIRSNWIE